MLDAVFLLFSHNGNLSSGYSRSDQPLTRGGSEWEDEGLNYYGRRKRSTVNSAF